MASDIVAKADCAASKAECLLLMLPRELRNMIYELVVVDRAYDEKIPVLIPSSGAFSGPSLLHVNHQLQNEALEHYFARNDFRAILNYETKGLHIRDWCYRIPKAYLQSIRSFTIELDSGPSWCTASRALGTATSQRVADEVCDMANGAWPEVLMMLVVLIRRGVRPEVLRFEPRRQQKKLIIWFIGKMFADFVNKEMSRDVDWDCVWEMLVPRQRKVSQVKSHE